MSLFDEDPQDPRTMAPVTKAPTPIAQINAGMAPSNISKWDKIKAALGNAGNTAMSNMMPDPKGLEGLLSPEDFAASRKEGLLNLGLSLLSDGGYRPAAEQVSFGQALSHGITSARDAYGQSIDRTLHDKQVGQQVRQQRSILDSRAAIAKAYQAAPGETFEQGRKRLFSMFNAYTAAGDTEMAGKLEPVVRAIHEAKSANVGHVDLGDKVGIIDPKTGNVLSTIPKGETPGQGRSDARAAANETRTQTLQKNTIVRDFARATADYTKAEGAYSTLQGARANPKNFLTPMAALDAFARTINPGAAVRVGTLQMIKQYGSFGDKTQRYLDMASKGQWPPQMMDQIYSLVDGIMADHTTEFSRLREEAVARGADSGVDVDKILHKPRVLGAPKASGKNLPGNPFAAR